MNIGLVAWVYTHMAHEVSWLLPAGHPSLSAWRANDSFAGFAVAWIFCIYCDEVKVGSVNCRPQKASCRLQSVNSCAADSLCVVDATILYPKGLRYSHCVSKTIN